MLKISNLRPLRMSRGLKRPELAASTLIALPRLQELELRKAEPWLDEAFALARVLGCSPHDLMAPDDLKLFDFDHRFHEQDLTFWTDGYRLPLSIGLRLQHWWSLDTIEDLDPSPLMRQLWDIMEANERHPSAPGWCPWCQAHRTAGEPHLESCIPHNLLGRRNRDGSLIGTVEAPLPGKRGHRTGSARVRGLKSIRQRKGWTQADMARYLDYHVNHYSRIERGELPLTTMKADEICAALQVTRDQLFNGIHAT